MNLLYALVPMLLLCSSSDFCSCIDTISSSKTIHDSESIVSSGGTFKLGFFTPANSTERYVGILYNIPIVTPIWVANRDKPLNDSSGTLTISEDGNIIVLDGQKQIVWSTNVSNPMENSSAKLLDTGNLVLQGNSSEVTLWESFQNLTDSYLPSMRLGMNVNMKQTKILTSWRSPSDPSIGSFSFGLYPLNVPEMVLWNGTNKHWRSGPWNGQIFIGVEGMSSDYRRGFILKDDREGSVSLTYTYTSDTVLMYYFMLSSEGNLMQRYWLKGQKDWEVSWSSLQDECDVYGKCGPNGICSSLESPVCSCLKGFVPVDYDEWGEGNWTSGCARRTEMNCGNQNTTRKEVKEDGFLKFSSIKVPDFAESLVRIDDCEKLCFSNCSCIAYAIYSGIGCMVWNGSLIDIKRFSGGNGTDLYLRVANSELDKKRSLKVVIITSVVIGMVTILIFSYVAWRLFTRKRGRKQKIEQLIYGRDYSDDVISESTINRVKVEELQIFNFEKLAAATRNFHIANKLGQGGFGPVYKGTLPDGQEIAIKRLSRSSGQGVVEFMNEVVLISKLQHRNLVRLLGCSVEREEKMLIYEYMPNRSLDSHLFDPLGQEHLGWSKRAKIIEGIGRGLMYLHRDSRLRIIHRDLKASNILLDQELNPKISDFGMARIFGGDQDQAKTKRVVGTYGYMAPEYAMYGRFSEKSDVYSFGVVRM